jgi:hypothetical protein
MEKIMIKSIRQKTMLGTVVGMTLLGDLAQAHQFSTTALQNIETSSHFLQTIMIEASSPLSENEKEAMYATGVESIVYVGNLHYYLYGSMDSIEKSLDVSKKITEAKAIVPSSKVSKHLVEHEDGLSSLGNGAPLNFNILLIKEMSEASLEHYFEEAGIKANISHVMQELKSAKIRIAAEDYEKVKNLPIVQYMDRSHSLGLNDSSKEVRNGKSTNYENITPLWRDSYHLNGEGMSVAVIDGGFVRKSHQEFVENGVSRVFLKGDGGDFADHATHVAGTITADGDDSKARGVANKSKLYSYTFLENSFADVTLKIYQEDAVLISNHSYGYSDMSKLGEYDTEAAKQDRAVSGNPFLNIFEAAGNDGEDTSYPAYGKIKGPGNSKNILTIGALNVNTSGVARFSSNGPTLDGRIKPELCARGESIYSTGSSSDNDYFWMSGTSMATPSVTGIGVLASQAYKRVSGGYDIRHDILKACMINSAVDKGRKGPDFDAGFGMVDAKATVDMINSLSTSKPLIYADSVKNGETKRLLFGMPNSGKFKATISWIDPEASPSASKALVNDIDMWLENSAGKRFYPYTLNAENPTALATNNRANHVDNNEQIEVAYLPKGSYTLVIHGSLIVTQSQEFALASNVSISNDSHLDVLLPSQLHNFAKVMQNALY